MAAAKGSMKMLKTKTLGNLLLGKPSGMTVMAVLVQIVKMTAIAVMVQNENCRADCCVDHEQEAPLPMARQGCFCFADMFCDASSRAAPLLFLLMNVE